MPFFLLYLYIDIFFYSNPKFILSVFNPFLSLLISLGFFQFLKQLLLLQVFSSTCLFLLPFKFPLIHLLQLHVHLRRFLGPPAERRAGLHASVLPGVFHPDSVRRCRPGTALPLGQRQVCPLGAKTTWAHFPCAFLPAATRYVHQTRPPFLSVPFDV